MDAPTYPVLYKETPLLSPSTGEKTRLLDPEFTPRPQEPNGNGYYHPYGGNSSKRRSSTPIFSPRASQQWQRMSATLPEEPHSWWKGPLLAFLSGTFFTLGSTGVKALKSIDPMELLVMRSGLQIVAMVAIALCNGKNLLGPKGHRFLLQLQGFVGAMTLVLLFFTFRRLPLGDATAIIFSSPVFVMIMSFLILREPCGFFRTVIICLLLAGVVLIAKPPFIFQFFVHTDPSYDVLGYTSAVLAALFTALNIVVMRKCKDVHYSVVVLSLSVWSLIASSSLLLGFHYLGGAVSFPSTWQEWILAAGVSSLGLSGQMLVAKALGLEGAGKVAVIRSLDIILAFILQITLFQEIPDWMSGLGAAFVLLCVIGMTFEPQVGDLFRKIP